MKKHRLFRLRPWKLFPFTTKKTRLQKAFEYVRNTFFPHWDTDHQWKIKFVPKSPSGGRAEPDTKIIILSSLPKDIDALHLILIHEICHAATQSGHSKKWINRLSVARDKAQELGMFSLSKKLQDEIDIYTDPTGIMSLTAANVYGNIKDFVLVAVIESRSYRYEKIIKAVAQGFGLYPHELEQRFKKCRQVYDKALKDAKETKERLD